MPPGLPPALRRTFSPIYNGVSFVPTSIVSELSATRSYQAHVASNIYDFYIFTPERCCHAWNRALVGLLGRAVRSRLALVREVLETGGAALSRLSGILTNAASMTMRYGPNGTLTTAVAANQATYVGSMVVDGTNGQVSVAMYVMGPEPKVRDMERL